ncbi:MAG TPA: response regulator [Caulobacteraceae bacterium]|jgi:CheY-like chemotaxis protein|nr:response regulator [Caulobacteraceae bacterium]
MTTTSNLNGLRLLLVEDEALVAMEAEDMLNDLGCVVVDVAGTLERGLAVAGDPTVELDGAVLDINLGGEKVYPVADALLARGVPFIFASGYGAGSVALRYAHAPVLAKPYQPKALEERLAAALASAPTR